MHKKYNLLPEQKRKNAMQSVLCKAFFQRLNIWNSIIFLFNNHVNFDLARQTTPCNTWSEKPKNNAEFIQLKIHTLLILS